MSSSSGIEQIRKDEGFLSTAKTLEFGKGLGKERSIGHGFNLDSQNARESLILAGVAPQDVDKVMSGEASITKEQGDSLFQGSIVTAEKDARSLASNFSAVPQDVKDVLTNMSFQLGKNKLSDFREMLKAVEDEDWDTMRKEMLDTSWAKQTPNRAKRLAGKIGGIKSEPKPKRTAVGRQVDAKSLYDHQLFNNRADEVASLLSSEQVLDDLADLIVENKVSEPENKIDINKINAPKSI